MSKRGQTVSIWSIRLAPVFSCISRRSLPVGVVSLYPDGYRAFFDVNVVLLFIPFVITVIATALTKPKDPWRAAMIVFAPTMILAATINWDLIPIALVALAFLAWSKDKPILTGVFLGLAIASKFYPVFFTLGFYSLSVANKILATNTADDLCNDHDFLRHQHPVRNCKL